MNSLTTQGRGRSERKIPQRNGVKSCMYKTAYTALYCNRLIMRQPKFLVAGLRGSPARTMPIAEPETALASTIVAGLVPEVIAEKIRAPAARQAGSTTFQQLTRRLNDLAFSLPGNSPPTVDANLRHGNSSPRQFFAGPPTRRRVGASRRLLIRPPKFLPARRPAISRLSS